MCDNHSGILIRVLTPSSGWTTKGIDACIAPLVEGLNASGIRTVASCCGHGHRPGTIALADGRELIIAPNYDTARAVDKAFPVTAYGEIRGASE